MPPARAERADQLSRRGEGRHAATNDSVAGATRIWRRRRAGHTRCTDVVPRMRGGPDETLPTTKYWRLSIEGLWLAAGCGPRSSDGRCGIQCAMPIAQIHDALARLHVVSGRQLLTHDFYQRWEAGTLAEGLARCLCRAIPSAGGRAAGDAVEGQQRAVARGTGSPVGGGTTWPTSSVSPLPTPNSARVVLQRRRAQRTAVVVATPGHGRAAGGRAGRLLATDPVAALSWHGGRLRSAGGGPSRPPSQGGYAAVYGFDVGRDPLLGCPRDLQESAHAGWSMDALEAMGAPTPRPSAGGWRPRWRPTAGWDFLSAGGTSWAPAGAALPEQRQLRVPQRAAAAAKARSPGSPHSWRSDRSSAQPGRAGRPLPVAPIRRRW